MRFRVFDVERGEYIADLGEFSIAKELADRLATDNKKQYSVIQITTVYKTKDASYRPE